MCAGCVHSGVHYDHAANWRSAENPCDVCFCSVGRTLADSLMFLSWCPLCWNVLSPHQEGRIRCERERCNTPCSNPAAPPLNNCCPVCEGGFGCTIRPPVWNCRDTVLYGAIFQSLSKSMFYQIEGVIYWLRVRQNLFLTIKYFLLARRFVLFLPKLSACTQICSAQMLRYVACIDSRFNFCPTRSGCSCSLAKTTHAGVFAWPLVVSCAGGYSSPPGLSVIAF